ncbi:Dna Dc-_Du-Editing Enzyme Apobec-3F [Manis pentadactyla]|nr:Dna Dc->Du-Editing Enzyme Apobec-3F [Manis pentadactyla]
MIVETKAGLIDLENKSTTCPVDPEIHCAAESYFISPVHVRVAWMRQEVLESSPGTREEDKASLFCACVWCTSEGESGTQGHLLQTPIADPRGARTIALGLGAVKAVDTEG